MLFGVGETVETVGVLCAHAGPRPKRESVQAKLSTNSHKHRWVAVHRISDSWRDVGPSDKPSEKREVEERGEAETGAVCMGIAKGNHTIIDLALHNRRKAETN